MGEIGEVTRGGGREGAPDSWDAAAGISWVRGNDGEREAEGERNEGMVKEPGETDGMARGVEGENKGRGVVGARRDAKRGRQGCARGSAVSCWHYS